jgi:hypothetical protein
LRDRASTSGADGDLRAVITALDDDDLATIWSDDTTLGWVSEALVLTDGEADLPRLDQLRRLGARRATRARARRAGRRPPRPDGLTGHVGASHDLLRSAIAARSMSRLGRHARASSGRP